jgi:hypothetical protein
MVIFSIKAWGRSLGLPANGELPKDELRVRFLIILPQGKHARFWLEFLGARRPKREIALLVEV